MLSDILTVFFKFRGSYKDVSPFTVGQPCTLCKGGQFYCSDDLCDSKFSKGLCTADDATELNQFSSVQLRRWLCSTRRTLLKIGLVRCCDSVSTCCRMSQLVVAPRTDSDATELNWSDRFSRVASLAMRSLNG